MTSFPIFRQMDNIDCGPTCLKMVLKHYGQDIELDYLRERCYINREGVSLVNIAKAAEDLNIKTLMLKISYEQLKENAPLPCILHWNQNHYVVLYDIKEKKHGKTGKDLLFIADPAHGKVKLDQETFLKTWISDDKGRGVALLMEPDVTFAERSNEKTTNFKGFGFLYKYFRPYKRYIIQLLMGMLFGSLVALIIPFLTQSLVDYGIRRNSMSFIAMILLAQLGLAIGSMAIAMIRNWVVLHMNTRMSVQIISDFLSKLMKLPIRFFDSRSTGDITQRINDHERIERFLTGTSITTVFSLINLLVFSAVLAIYNIKILGVFVAGASLSVAWIFIFMKRRMRLDYKRFQAARENQDSIFEMVQGMQEIKLNDAEMNKRWNWEKIQARLFKIQVKSLSYSQYQELGSITLNQLKNIFITYLAAQMVISGSLTLGMMLSIAYIIGQMNGPLDQLINFFTAAQEARLSLDRLGEVHNRPNEELETNEHPLESSLSVSPQGNFEQHGVGDIVLQNLSFQYEGPHSPYVLKNINLVIPEGNVTAIVGASGSGKTTLMKLLLKFYSPVEGNISVGRYVLENLSANWWRRQCGTVLQDGYIFSDTVAHNIALSGGEIDEKRMYHATDVANISEFIDSLPLKYTTKIGANGVGLSGGQLQRILIARAVYKNPHYLFFDEATSALDANNESNIIDKLQSFFKGKTVVIIAHRLSTVKNADKIVVLDHGEIVETGDHETLIRQKGPYFNLVRNQLELGA